jgi:hypothetical protein
MKHIYDLKNKELTVNSYIKHETWHRYNAPVYLLESDKGSYIVTSIKMINFIDTMKEQGRKTFKVRVIKKFCGEALHFELVE